jgi:hypothetical protein
MSIDPLHDPKSKVEWAKRNIANLEVAIRRFFDSNPLRQEEVIYPERGEVEYKVFLDRPLDIEIVGLMHNAVHDLRSALDYLACCEARRNGHSNVSQTYFPFGKTKDIFESPEVQRKVKKLSAEAITCINALKPYKGGNDLLYAIHELDLAEKHTKLLPVGIVTPAMGLNLSLPGAGQRGIPIRLMYPRWENLHEGMVLISGEIGTNPKGEFRLSLNVAFAEADGVKGQPVVVTLNQMASLVSDIIETFERNLFKSSA